MLFLAIIMTIAACIFSLFVLFANGISDAPSRAFQGGWLIGLVWLCAAVLYVAWYFG